MGSSLKSQDQAKLDFLWTVRSHSSGRADGPGEAWTPPLCAWLFSASLSALALTL